MRTFTNTPRDTANKRIPNWKAKKASRVVKSVRDSPAMNIKSLGDITNNPPRTSSLTHGSMSYQPEGHHGEGTDRVNVASDQAVIVPSGSSGLVVKVGDVGFCGLSDMSWSSKVSTI